MEVLPSRVCAHLRGFTPVDAVYAGLCGFTPADAGLGGLTRHGLKGSRAFTFTGLRPLATVENNTVNYF